MKHSDVMAWPEAKGKKELLAHLVGNPLTPRQSILAQCYSCMGGFTDGRVGFLVDSYPLRPLQVYHEGGPRKTKTLTKEQKQAARERLNRVRAFKTG